MGLFDFIFAPFDQIFAERIDTQIEDRIQAAIKQPSSGPLSSVVEGQAVMMSAKTVEDWKLAVMAATDPDNPDWSLLFQLHDNMWLDDHLASVVESRILHTKSHPFKLVNDNDEENTELNWLLERPWFYDLIELALMSKFRGRKMLEMYEIHTDGDYIGELKTIAEIQQPYFNTKKGIIIKRSGDTTGFNYQEQPYKGFYVQIGKDMDLGMFTWMAPIVLAKKLGMGAWLDLIDKYGVPPLFINTDREDEGRLRQLFSAAMKFKRNNFMITRGNEKIEVPTMGGNSIAPHESLQKRGDELISKRVLGGTGLTDEKGFVGSVEIQYKLAKDRFNSDKLFFEYFFNAEIKPRLVNLSPVYAGLKDHYFKWDNTEVLSVKELIDAIVNLGSLYDIDIEWVAKMTGIPVTGIKQLMTESIQSQKEKENPEETEDTKKKSVKKK